ncbi:MAG TPA: hypothetical protein VGR06_12770 [Actinophytocola sp.]|jgi:hypothetical protein|uniref:hypothetical protein n=1 Tax=Actinophytocola sp. TaxID=1872138 RepID=UPI002DF88EBE|nr:hypothetical protein [Actinophytocola sp.]
MTIIPLDIEDVVSTSLLGRVNLPYGPNVVPARYLADHALPGVTVPVPEPKRTPTTTSEGSE